MDINNQNEKESLHFIEQIVVDDIKSGKNESRVHTRFPPEPNGYIHIGHAKSILLNFGLAKKYDGKFNLRFDDTNPVAEEVEYVESIKQDVKWLGANWEDRLYFASDYFDQLYEWAIKMIKDDKAYVCELSSDEINTNRGVPTKPGIESPYRNRPVAESLDLFERMKNGEFPDNSMTLRAKINMASPNMHMRDPIIYRILHKEHHRTGNKWCIYPMYDFAHGQSDYIEGITHSLCTLEFEVHRPLYDWLLDQIIDTEYRPRQIEFARFNLSYTVMSKRKLLRLVKENYVNGWDDPRMPTITGMRRRGYTPESIQMFAEKIGVAKRENLIDVSLLEFCIREDLNKKVNRAMAVMDPIKVTISNYPEGKTEMLSGTNNPEDEAAGKREIPFSRELYIERNDFMEDPPRKYFRLAPDKEVRLRWAYFIKCQKVIKDDAGNVIELICSYDPESKGGKSPDGRKVKGTIQWISVPHAKDAEVRLYDRLFKTEVPDKVEEGGDFIDNLNPDSLHITTCKIEPSLMDYKTGERVQFERIGYFSVDPDSKAAKPVFNRIVTLRDSWSKRK